MKNFWFLFIFIFIGSSFEGPFVFASLPTCDQTIRYDFSEDYQLYKEKLKRNECKRKWTLLIYMAADNDLSPYSLWDIYEMEHKISGALNLGASTEHVDVIVELDTREQTGLRRLHIFQTDLEAKTALKLSDFEQKNESSIHSPVIQLLPEVGPGAIKDQSIRFENFLNFGLAEYPSEHTMVVIWGHGEGFIGTQTAAPRDNMGPAEWSSRPSGLLAEMSKIDLEMTIPESTYPGEKVMGGIAFDYSELSYIDLPTLAAIFKRVQNQSHKGRKIDLLAMDACLMQTLEVATELSDSAQFLLGSTQIQDYLGLPYRHLLDQLNLKTTPYQLAMELPVQAGEIYRQGYGHSSLETYTLSSLNLHELKYQFLPTLNHLGQRLLNYLAEDDFRIFELQFLLENSEVFEGETRDLGIFLGGLKRLLWLEFQREGYETPAALKLREMIDFTLTGLHQTMISASYGDLYINASTRSSENYWLGFFRGLGIWLPSSIEQFNLRSKEFTESKLWTEVPEYMALLNRLYSVE